jgi:hypothetical protein
MRENLRLVSSQDASAIKGRPHAIPSGYLDADVRGDGPAANMAAPENSRAEIAGRTAAMQLEIAEWLGGAKRDGKGKTE